MSAAHPLEVKLDASWPPANWQDMTIVLAVSGGPDSVALVRLLAAIRANAEGRMVVAHYNHGVRGADSIADQGFVERLCDELGLACEIGLAKRLTKTASDGFEATARKRRYAFLLKTAQRLGARYIVTAHTADDQAETILHRIVRGTGIAGLAGIPRVRPLDSTVSIVRPLLDFRRCELREYLTAIGQPFRTDKSNWDRQFTRNRIRTELIPALQTGFNTGIVDSLLRLGALAGEVQQLVDRQVGELSEQCVEVDSSGTVSVACHALARTDPYLVSELLIRVWKERGWPLRAMSNEKWRDLTELCLSTEPPQGIGKRSFPGGVCVEKKDGRLSLTRPEGTH